MERRDFLKALGAVPLLGMALKTSFVQPTKPAKSVHEKRLSAKSSPMSGRPAW